LTEKIRLTDAGFDPNGTKHYGAGLKNILLFIYRKLRGTYNIFNIHKLISGEK
ncbi:MAG: hypothetical protein GX452_14200, partial [Ignavibacteriales bacterium]|nr:hypothetical protein [Ignavibacteriales bacterium]